MVLKGEGHSHLKHSLACCLDGLGCCIAWQSQDVAQVSISTKISYDHLHDHHYLLQLLIKSSFFLMISCFSPSFTTFSAYFFEMSDPRAERVVVEFLQGVVRVGQQIVTIVDFGVWGRCCWGLERDLGHGEGLLC